VPNEAQNEGGKCRVCTDGWGELSPGGQQQSRLQCGDVRHNYGQPGSQRQSVCSRPDTVSVYGSLHYTPPATSFNVYRVYAVDLTATEVCQVNLGQPAVVGFLPRSLHLFGKRSGETDDHRQDALPVTRVDQQFQACCHSRSFEGFVFCSLTLC